MQRVIVTGATGAIGVALIEKCIVLGIEVLAIIHESSRRRENIPKHPLVSILECDLSNYSDYIPKENEKYDCFFHLAWSGTFGNTRNDMDLQIGNIQYTLDAVRLAKRFGCHTFVGAGSQAEYGRVEGMIHSNTPTFPENGYGMAKLCAGQMSRSLCQTLEMKHIWCRILSVYGPYDGEKTMVMTAIKGFLGNEKVSFSKGEQLWDYLYAKDAAKALIDMAKNGKDSAIYCLGSGQVRPLKEYIEVIRKNTNALEFNALYGDIPYGEKQVMHLQADITNLQEDTGFLPEYTFEEGIKETIEWYQQKTLSKQREKI